MSSRRALRADTEARFAEPATYAFTQAMGLGLLVAAALAAATAVIVARFLPTAEPIGSESDSEAAEPGLLPLAGPDRAG